MSTNEIKTDKNGLDYIFCGKAMSEKYGLVFSSHSDIERLNIDVLDLKEALGEFSLLTFEQDKVIFGADWYGMVELHYYDFEGLFVASTSYHLMLLVLVLLGENLSVNTNDITSKFLCEKYISHAGDFQFIYNCHINKPYEYFEFSAKVEIKNTELYRDVYEPEDFSQEGYENLIHKSADEITQNVKICFEHPDIDQVRVDLSGGLDTRIIYAVCTKLPNSLTKEKMYIFSSGSSTPNDKEVAFQINKIFGIPYENNATLNCIPMECQNKELFFNPRVSTTLGNNYFTGVQSTSDVNVNNQLVLNGGCGDILRADADGLPTIEFLYRYINCRNRVHFSAPVEQFACPLQSKSAIKAVFMYAKNHKFATCLKVEFDILSTINPLLSVLPFANKKISEFVARLENREAMYKFPNMQFEFPALPEDWEKTNTSNNYYRTGFNSFNYELYKPDNSFSLISEKLKSAGLFDEIIINGYPEDLRTDNKYKALVALCFQVDIVNGRGDFGE